jgi:hypothetical protein
MWWKTFWTSQILMNLYLRPPSFYSHASPAFMLFFPSQFWTHFLILPQTLHPQNSFTLIRSRNGCATSEDLFWKLDALQSFIRDLHWPDAEFRQHLEQRLKLMSCDMIESCLQRTEQSFQQWLKKSVTFISTDYIISTEMCAMVNVILDAKNQSFKLCSVDGIDVVSLCSDNHIQSSHCLRIRCQKPIWKFALGNLAKRTNLFSFCSVFDFRSML